LGGKINIGAGSWKVYDCVKRILKPSIMMTKVFGFSIKESENNFESLRLDVTSTLSNIFGAF